MTTNTRKARGMQTQARFAGYLREHGFPWATDAGPGRGGLDILNTPGLAWEVKARAAFDPLAWLRQARAAQGVPLVVWRPNGYGLMSMDAWPMMTLVGPGVELLRAAGYGDPLPD